MYTYVTLQRIWPWRSLKSWTRARIVTRFSWKQKRNWIYHIFGSDERFGHRVWSLYIYIYINGQFVWDLIIARILFRPGISLGKTDASCQLFHTTFALYIYIFSSIPTLTLAHVSIYIFFIYICPCVCV